jgi:hypothetical protein
MTATTFTITFSEVKSNKYLGKVAGKILQMKTVREVRKNEGNTTLTCVASDISQVKFDKVSGFASAAEHTVKSSSA